MKKLGIFAIGTLLFLAVSCDKNKTSLAPASPAATETVKPKPSGIRNDENINPGTFTEKTGKIPEKGIRNGEAINTATYTERTDISRPVRNDMNSPFNDPRRFTRVHVRNDVENPFNDPR